MIKIKFTRGSAYIDTIIEGRTLSFITPLLNFVPVKINLDKLDEEKDKLKKMKMDKEMINQLSKLKTEKDMAKDLMDDLKKTGWEVLDYGIS